MAAARAGYSLKHSHSMHIETIGFSATAPGAAGAAAAALTGDSLTVKNSKTAPRIIAWNACQQGAGFQQLVFPSGHDTTRNTRVTVPGLVGTGAVDFTLPFGIQIEVQPQEVLSLTVAGSATAGDVELGYFLVYYDDLPGMAARLISYDDVMRMGKKFLTVQATINGAAAGYTGSELITADSDLLHANTDYAIIGIETATDVAGVTIVGPDTSNVKIACPGMSTKSEICGQYFGMLSRATGLKTVPVINSGNKANTFIGLIQNEVNANVQVSLNLVML